MNKYFSVTVILIVMCLTNTAMAIDQSANNLIRAHIYGDDSATGQWSYGNLTMKFDDTDFVVTSVFTSDGGVWTIDLETGIGGVLTTVWVTDPLTGTGTSIDPIDVTADGIDDSMIDFGTGAGQVASDDLPLSNSSTTEILYNLAGYATGDPDFYWNETTNVLTVSSGGASISIDGANDTITASGGLIGFGDENLVTTGNLLFNKWDITGTTPTANYLPYVASAAGDVATMGWINPATLSTAPGGSDTHVQYNNGGVFGGEADFAWNDTSKQLLIGAPVATVTNIQLIGDGGASFAGSVYSGDEVHVGWGGISAENEGELWLHDGDSEGLGVRVIDIAANTELDLSAIGAWTDDYIVAIDTSPVSGPAFVAVNPATITPDTNTHVDSIFGYHLVDAPAFNDQYLDITGTTHEYAGTGATDSIGFSMPWACSIVGIAVNYTFIDVDSTLQFVVYPREDGANIDANCKLTVDESATPESVSVTFAAGTYTVAANQALGIYVDVTGTIGGALQSMNDLIVTVYYSFSL